MANEEIVSYIRSCLSQNQSGDEVKRSLREAGWGNDQIEAAFATAVPLPNTPPTPPTTSIATVGMASPKPMGRFRASYLLATESLELLRKDKEVMVFPILSFLASIALFAVVASAVFFGMFQGDLDALEQALASAENDTTQTPPPYGAYVAMFVYYIMAVFITVFFEFGIVTIVHARINGNDLAFRDGIRAAAQNTGKIFVWSCVTATVGVILQFIADRVKLLGKIIVSLFGAAWNILTFFIVPVLALEHVGIKDSIRHSGQTFKKTWGETLIVNISAGLFLGIVAFVVLFLIIAGGVGLAIVFEGAMGVILVVTAVFALLSMLFFAIVSATLSVVFKVVLYEYAKTGRAVAGFSPELLLSAIGKQTKTA